MDVRVREQVLPGIGHRYELQLQSGDHLTVVVLRDGRRQVTLGQAHGEAHDVAALTQDEAVAVAAILTGARFSIDTSDDDRFAGDEVTVETVTVAKRSPAIGRLARDVALPPDCEAEILAVIRDDTPELVEDDDQQPVQAGDRIVVAARRERLAEVLGHLAG